MSDPLGPVPDGAHTARGEVFVAAPAEAVWPLVSDLAGMGRLSPENTGGRWLSGAPGAVGSRFLGHNRNGRLRWSTLATVRLSEPGRTFAFEVSAGPLAVSSWAFVITPEAGGCRVMESWVDRRLPAVRLLAGLVERRRDRRAHTEAGIEHTLARVKQLAEAPA